MNTCMHVPGTCKINQVKTISCFNIHNLQFMIFKSLLLKMYLSKVVNRNIDPAIEESSVALFLFKM